MELNFTKSQQSKSILPLILLALFFLSGSVACRPNDSSIEPPAATFVAQQDAPATPTLAPTVINTAGPPTRTPIIEWGETPAPPPTMTMPIPTRTPYVATLTRVPAVTVTAPPPPSPTAVPTPIALPMPTITNGLDYNLLYLDGGDLRHWNRITGEVTVLAAGGNQPIVDFAASDSGERVLLKRQISTTTSALFDLFYLNTATDTIVRLATDVGRLRGVTELIITANGTFGSYLRSQGDEAGGEVLAVSLNNPDQTFSLGTCRPVAVEQGAQLSRGCSGLARDKETTHVLWSDGDGIKRAQLNGTPADILYTYPPPGDEAIPLGFLIRTWSESGRYLLLDGYYFEGGRSFVLDTESGRLGIVPRSDAYLFVPHVAMLDDDRLLVIAPPDPINMTAPQATIYAFAPDGDRLLVELTTFAITVDERTYPDAPVGPLGWVAGPDLFSRDVTPFLIISPSPEESGLYHFDQTLNHVARISGLPYNPNSPLSLRLLFVPLGQGLIVNLTDYNANPDMHLFYYVDAVSGTAVDLTLAIGPGAEQLTWIRP